MAQVRLLLKSHAEVEKEKLSKLFSVMRVAFHGNSNSVAKLQRILSKE